MYYAWSTLPWYVTPLVSGQDQVWCQNVVILGKHVSFRILNVNTSQHNNSNNKDNNEKYIYKYPHKTAFFQRVTNSIYNDMLFCTLKYIIQVKYTNDRRLCIIYFYCFLAGGVPCHAHTHTHTRTHKHAQRQHKVNQSICRVTNGHSGTFNQSDLHCPCYRWLKGYAEISAKIGECLFYPGSDELFNSASIYLLFVTHWNSYKVRCIPLTWTGAGLL